uniref:Protein FAF-like, chloroplastic n=1 Tax=Meloidogyne hapla TaxID=6305 RepID=A0A1I8BH55_MELHA
MGKLLRQILNLSYNLKKFKRSNSSIDDDDVEEVVSVSIASSALDNSSCLSVPILFRRNSAISSVASASTFQQETAIIVEEIEAENCTETFFLRRRNKHSILNAVIYPEQHASVKATFCGNNFQVDVERMSECGRDSVVMVSEEFCEKKVLIRSGSPLLKSTIMEEIERENSDSPGYTDAHTRMAVSINAKSDYDSVHVFLEEIPWGQIGIEVKESPSPLNNKRNKITTNISSGIILF